MLAELLEKYFGDRISIVPNATPYTLLVAKENLLDTMNTLHSYDDFFFDRLTSISGVDFPEKSMMEVVYHLDSIPREFQLAIKVQLDRKNPVVPSVSAIWKSADWHERETYDLFGIEFTGHPDLRRILLPSDWKGHPLRKDYQEQEKYHGITVNYQRDEPQDSI